MPDKNDFSRASGAIVNLEGLRRDIRANAFEYMARVHDQQPLDGIMKVIEGNSIQYVRRIKDWYQADRADPIITKQMENGLSVDPSVFVSDLDALATKILGVAQAESDGVKNVKSYDDVVQLAQSTINTLPFVK